MPSQSDSAGICCQLAPGLQRPSDLCHHFRARPEQILVVDPDFAPAKPFRQSLPSDVTLVLLGFPVMVPVILKSDPFLHVSRVRP